MASVTNQRRPSQQWPGIVGERVQEEVVEDIAEGIRCKLRSCHVSARILNVVRIALTKTKMHGTISRVRSGRWTASHTSCCSINCSSSGVLLPEEEFIASGGYEIGLWVFEREEIRCKT